MFDRLKAFFDDRGGHGQGPEGRHSHDEKQLAAAALLIEAAMLDGDFEEAEQAVVHQLVRDRFGVNETEADSLLREAQASQAESTQLIRYTRAVKDHFSETERIELIEMLWEVAYADGTLHDYEANLLRRVAGLIYVSDRDRGAARKRVLERLGLSQD